MKFDVSRRKQGNMVGFAIIGLACLLLLGSLSTTSSTNNSNWSSSSSNSGSSSSGSSSNIVDYDLERNE